MKVSYKIWSILFLFCLLLSSGSEARSKAGQGIPGKYSPLKISGRVSSRAGSFAWSQDGSRIAYLEKEVFVYEPSSGSRRAISISNPVFIAWGAADELYVIHLEQGRRSVSVVNTSSQYVRRLQLPVEPDSLYPVKGGSGLLLVESKISARALWADCHFIVSSYEPGADTLKNIYETEIRFLVKKAVPEELKGRLKLELNPLESLALLPEYVRPPNAATHAKVVLVDYITGRSKVAGKIETPDFFLPVSWSPDGSRFAYPDQRGRLSVNDLKGGGKETGGSIIGHRPAWNPRGSQIFFGGALISSDGKAAETLVSGGTGSIGAWSPDGKRLLLYNQDELWLLSGFSPYPVSPDRVPADELRKKVQLLKELLADELITEQEYQQRFKILNDAILNEDTGGLK